MLIDSFPTMKEPKRVDTLVALEPNEAEKPMVARGIDAFLQHISMWLRQRVLFTLLDGGVVPSREVAKKQFRALSLIFHPDKIAGASDWLRAAGIPPSPVCSRLE
jgi:hypothetical protein